MDTPITIAVLGAGRVGTALATALASAGHAVLIGTRNPDGDAQQVNTTSTTVMATTAAITAADLVINATPGDSTLERLTAEQNALAGKVLLDVSNATTRTPEGLPGGLQYPGSSLGEHLQAALPGTRVVKSLNTMLYSVMTAPGALANPPSAFLSGNDTDAKDLVRGVLRDIGWPDEWMIDLGPIDTARGTEAIALLVPSLLGALGFQPFALTIAR